MRAINHNETIMKIEDVMKLNDLELLKNELRKREVLFSNLVGNLYRSIVWDELLDVRERIWQVTQKIH